MSPSFFPKNFKHDPTATASPELSSSTSSLSPSVKTAMMLSDEAKAVQGLFNRHYQVGAMVLRQGCWW